MDASMFAWRIGRIKGKISTLQASLDGDRLASPRDARTRNSAAGLPVKRPHCSPVVALSKSSTDRRARPRKTRCPHHSSIHGHAWSCRLLRGASFRLLHRDWTIISILKLVSTISARAAACIDVTPVVKKLESTGCSHAEAAGMLKALEGVFKEAGDSIMAAAVKRDEHEKSAYQQKVEFNRFKSEIQLAAKQDFGVLKAEGDRNLAELETLRQRLKEETARTTASVRLDLSFERGRIREDLGARDIRIREIDGRIDNEVQNIRANNAMMRSQSMQYAVGTLGVAASLLFGYLRLFR